MKSLKHKKNVNYKKRILFYFIFFVLFFISIGYAYMNTTLSINSHVVVSADTRTRVGNLLKELAPENTCIVKYEGEVTDQVAQTVNATKVYLDECADKSNVKFGGFCWQIIRTTETGGVKMIYNGEPDQNGECGLYRENHAGIKGGIGSYSNLSNEYLYGSSFTYDTTNNTFTLIDTTTATWSDSTYQDLIGKYTCLSLSDNCTQLERINGYYDYNGAYTSSYIMYSVNYNSIADVGFNDLMFTPDKVGYMFNEVSHSFGGSSPNSNSLIGNDVSYSNGMYTLLPADGESTLGTTMDDTHHYTCNNTTGTCSKVRFYYNSVNYVELDGEANINEVLNNMLYSENANRYNSAIKGVIDSWYAQNLITKTDMLEDAVYCNDRSMANQTTNGWNKDGNLSTNLQFKNYTQVTDLICQNETDQFAVANNKAKLTYPVALFQGLEMYTTIPTASPNWSLSPYDYRDTANGIYVWNGINGVSVMNVYGVRPVITLKGSNIVSSGTGAEDDPWVVE